MLKIIGTGVKVVIALLVIYVTVGMVYNIITPSTAIATTDTVGVSFTEHKAILVERDKLKAERNKLKAEQDNIKVERDRALAERNRLVRDLDKYSEKPLTFFGKLCALISGRETYTTK